MPQGFGNAICLEKKQKSASDFIHWGKAFEKGRSERKKLATTCAKIRCKIQNQIWISFSRWMFFDVLAFSDRRNDAHSKHTFLLVVDFLTKVACLMERRPERCWFGWREDIRLLCRVVHSISRNDVWECCKYSLGPFRMTTLDEKLVERRMLLQVKRFVHVFS